MTATRKRAAANLVTIDKQVKPQGGDAGILGRINAALNDTNTDPRTREILEGFKARVEQHGVVGSTTGALASLAIIIGGLGYAAAAIAPVVFTSIAVVFGGSVVAVTLSLMAVGVLTYLLAKKFGDTLAKFANWIGDSIAAGINFAVTKVTEFWNWITSFFRSNEVAA